MNKTGVLIVLLLIFVGIVGYSYYKDYADSQKADSAEQNPAEKQILLVFTKTDCPPCNRFKKDALNNNKLRKELAKYNLIYIDGRSPVYRFEVDSYPTFILVKSDRITLIKKTEGYTGVDDFIKWLN